MMCQPAQNHSFSLVCLIDGWESPAVASGQGRQDINYLNIYPQTVIKHVHHSPLHTITT